MRNGSPVIIFALALTLPTASSWAQVVTGIPGFNATYPAGQIGGSSATGVPTNYIKVEPAKEYYLDYDVFFQPGWEWVKDGKLPGLVGGTHTSGCDSIVADGWSARFMWRQNGAGQFYYYHQNRVNSCGDELDFPSGKVFKIGAWNRITEHVIINNPGQTDGSAEAWLNGEKVIALASIAWRGNVGATVALIDQVSLQTFYGGSTMDWAPPDTTYSRFDGFKVQKDLPDFSLPFQAVSGLKRKRTGFFDSGIIGSVTKYRLVLWADGQSHPVSEPTLFQDPIYIGENGRRMIIK